MAMIKVYALPIGEKGFIKEIDNSLTSFQSEVDGYIEIVSLDREGVLDLVCNEEGKINELPLNRAWVDKGKIIEVIAGNCFVTRHDDEGNSTSIEDADVRKIEETLKMILGMIGNTMILAKEEPNA